ncbi:MAG: exonuclease domain-containing protein [Acetobacter sp.]|nr:exonuclease domain-containing protein [Bacteroides sp.]MCM1341418.1 exonuclease domain-containing protein [Acetobacter sp.]MCM1433372.1 exonuclease domain-containing protein [Clostridiales bacterium]
MNYIIFDLEWNNAYNYKLKKGTNEIVEIGAVKLNEKLDIIDSFKQLIKPALAKSLTNRFKNLTHITMDEIKKNGISFDAAFEEFSRWCGGGDLLFLSWSRSDLHTLVENYLIFKNTANIDFIKKYADAQQYCMNFIEGSSAGMQISLSNCAAEFDIEVDTENLHRALEDCYLTALCLKKVFDDKLINDYIHECDIKFFERIVFKPFFINKARYSTFDLADIKLICQHCKKNLEIIKPYQFYNNAFTNIGKCPECKRSYWVNIRAKKTYDDIIVSSRVIEMNKKRAKKYQQ